MILVQLCTYGGDDGGSLAAAPRRGGAGDAQGQRHFKGATNTYWSNFFQPPNTGSYRCHPTQRPYLPKRAPKTASERGYPAPPIPTPTQQISASSCAHKANEGAISRFRNRSKR